ncbi:hypothetical protein [Gelidibacter gilvus]|uniref:GNAT family N-acetyltransferase n=1 Tax=Gelidibacter gilvus TaxID=59602 RepID=A0A4Q0XGZ6_9FLAO|nr:hypothetical protein [Gelidibacter gilvus]RXJ46036.1 hypothetical protein ESZ48_13155 [Gelidibacter gilvus]
MAVTLREVEKYDFDQIYQLFIEVYGKQPFDGFKKAFFDHDLLLGYCLIDTSIETQPMVGYFGCFTYYRTIDDIPVKFYNSHTWIVKEAYRKQSLKLLMPYMRLKDGIVTNFSANGKVAQILEQLKFSKLGIVNTIIKPSYSMTSFLAQVKIKSIPIQSAITKWHEPYIGLSLNLKLPNQEKTLELVLKAVDKKPAWVKQINNLARSLTTKPLVTKSYFLYKVHYTNSPEMLIENVDSLIHYLFFKKKVGGLVLPESFIEVLPSDRIDTQYKDTIYVKANQDGIPMIDYLYSEVFYLNIGDK